MSKWREYTIGELIPDGAYWILVRGRDQPHLARMMDGKFLVTGYGETLTSKVIWYADVEPPPVDLDQINVLMKGV